MNYSWPFHPDLRLSANGRRKLLPHQEAKLVAAERERAGWEMKAAGFKPFDEYAVQVEWVVIFKNYRLAYDADSLAPAFKPWLDAMTDIGLWPDDGPKYLAKVSYTSAVVKDVAPMTILKVEPLR